MDEVIKCEEHIYVLFLLLGRRNGDKNLSYLYLQGEKKGEVIFLLLLMTNLEQFDHDLTVEHRKQQVACCIYGGVMDSKASGAGHN